jgi:F0F1-type ATP synthase assembly protein I
MGKKPEISPEPKKPGRYDDYLKYSGLAFQLVIAIGIMGLLGYRLDQYLGFSFPLFMLLFGMVSFGWLLYKLYRSLNKE